MTTIREAAQMAMDALADTWTCPKDQATQFQKEIEAMEAVEAALAQPEQKPVAQVQVAEDYYPHVVFLDGVDTTGLDQKFLYTAPTQREWQSLTDEEMHECWDSPLTPLGMKCVRAIEKALREKNT